MSKKMTPGYRPQMKREDAEKLLSLIQAVFPVKLLGVRGYFMDTMGEARKNDRSIYDDAMFIVAPNFYSSFTANVDPSVSHPGVAMLKANIRKNITTGKIEVLNPYPYLYKIGKHGISGPRPYKALRQFGRVTVIRDGAGEQTDTAGEPFYINIHKGSLTTTSSLGCQTIHPSQWLEFIKAAEDQMKQNSQPVVPYILTEYIC